MGRKSGKAARGQPDDLDAPAGIAAGFANTESMFRRMRGLDADPEGQAQDLVLEAMGCDDPEAMIDLLNRALEIDPGNIDALLMISELIEFKNADRIDFLRKLLAHAKERLGSKAFQELAPNFWGFVETRPYMRVHLAIAEELRERGRLAEAAKEYTAMLDLNKHDNQGARYFLLQCLLALGRLDEARDLFTRFKDNCEWDASFAWGRVLERFLSGDEPGAVAALAAARKQNPHLEPYLDGRRKTPKNIPDAYRPGSHEEARYYAPMVAMAWQAKPEALAWLVRQRTEAVD